MKNTERMLLFDKFDRVSIFPLTKTAKGQEVKFVGDLINRKSDTLRERIQEK
jgi:hypothetical protein